MLFEWDKNKNIANIKKHGISLELAATIFDDPMKKEYNFKKGVRGKFYRRNKVQKTLRIDEDILDFYKELAEKEGIPYQTLINLTLRKFASEGGSLVITTKKRVSQ